MRRLMIGAILITGALAFLVTGAAATTGASEPTGEAIAGEVAKKLARLPENGVFDDLSFEVENNNVILMGKASRPILKEMAGRVAARVEGVETVENRIEVLPLSNRDDQVREAVYRSIYRSPSLNRYAAAGPMMPSLTRSMQGITQDPPAGFHAIRIIVDRGHLTLKGMVSNDGDRNLAEIRAGTAFGVYSVTNDIQVVSSTDK
jgi:hypothetical protein